MKIFRFGFRINDPELESKLAELNDSKLETIQISMFPPYATDVQIQTEINYLHHDNKNSIEDFQK